MAVQSTLLLIADIAGYTRFMKMHDRSLVHAQQVIARLLEAVINAARPALKLAKLEGDAAFFHMPGLRSAYLPYTLRFRKACAGFRNLPDAH
jgi:hypothetical protein